MSGGFKILKCNKLEKTRFITSGVRRFTRALMQSACESACCLASKMTWCESWLLLTSTYHFVPLASRLLILLWLKLGWARKQVLEMVPRMLMVRFEYLVHRFDDLDFFFFGMFVKNEVWIWSHIEPSADFTRFFFLLGGTVLMQRKHNIHHLPSNPFL